jgi:tetratricopeptide (TPR) repeat protein
MRPSSLLQTLVVAAALLLSSAAGRAQSAADLIASGDAFDLKLQPTEALKFYLPAEKLEPANVELILRIARQYRHLMQDATKPDEKMRLGGIGREYAERAVKLAPNESEAHLSVAITDAKMVPMLSSKKRLEASKHMKAEIDRAIALDPSKDLAWHILGCWHQRLADVGIVMRTMAKLTYGSVPAATNDEAVKCFQQAIKLNPDRLIHYIELGRTYAQMGQPDDARRYIKKGLSMPDVGKDDPESKQRGRETMGKL